jgi:hypothetical protein
MGEDVQCNDRLNDVNACKCILPALQFILVTHNNKKLQKTSENQPSGIVRNMFLMMFSVNVIVLPRILNNDVKCAAYRTVPLLTCGDHFTDIW